MLLIAVAEGVVVPLASVAVMLEYEAVFKRSENMLACGLTAPDVDRFLDALASRVEPVVSHYSWRPTVRDANDELFVDVAVNGAADMIVTFNVADYRPADDRQSALGIPVCRPGDVLRRLAWRPSAVSSFAFRLRS